MHCASKKSKHLKETPKQSLLHETGRGERRLSARKQIEHRIQSLLLLLLLLLPPPPLLVVLGQLPLLLLLSLLILLALLIRRLQLRSPLSDYASLSIYIYG
mmetsp:Transcript_44/g.134  ORF Transcript_44/g.134 Transcript_44/m.134 type:complete len:101 (-) Transcript_44:9-311(-)